MPLHQRIDQLIRAGHPDYATAAAPRADDAEFLRRVYLDVAGVIPSTDAARAFLADKAPDRRAKLIDRLLASEKHAYHLATTFDVLLMDRRGNKHVKAPEWLGFLSRCSRRTSPTTSLVREILSADGSDPKTRPAARFFLDRDGEPHLLTKDISRLFLGMNLQCAQCHDHPLVNAYKQDHYYGIYAFLSRSYLYTDKKAKRTVLAEKGDGEVSFSSVFVAKVTKKNWAAAARGRGGAGAEIRQGQGIHQGSQEGEAAAFPSSAARAQLAARLTSPDNPRFAVLGGQSAVGDVPGSRPRASRRVRSRRQSAIAPRAAQAADRGVHCPQARSALAHPRNLAERNLSALDAVPSGKTPPDPAWFAVGAVRPLSPEQLAWSLLEATGKLGPERKAKEAALQAKLGRRSRPSPSCSATSRANLPPAISRRRSTRHCSCATAAWSAPG